MSEWLVSAVWAGSMCATWPVAFPRRASSPWRIRPRRWRKQIAAEFDVAKAYADPLAMIDDPAVDAIVIVTPTHTHRELVIAAAGARQADLL